MSLSKAKKAANTVAILMVANFIVKFFGLFREILIARYYGTSELTDAYTIAHNIPMILFSMVAHVIATTFIPMYSRISSERGEKEAKSFTLHLLQVLLSFCLIITLLGELFTKQVVYLFAPGFTGKKLLKTITFTRILLPSILGMTLFDLFGSYLQKNEKFKPIAIVPIVGNTVIIISLVVSNLYKDIDIFVFGILFGLIIQVLFYVPFVKKCGLFNSRWNGTFNDKYLYVLLPLIIPVIIGAGVNEINSLIDKSLVSGLKTGSVSALNYSYKILNLVVGVLVAAIVTVWYPTIANLASSGKLKEFEEKCNFIISVTFAIVLPISLFVILFRVDITTLLFQRGSFNEISTEMTSSALMFYSVGLSAIGIRDFLIRVFYCKQDTKTPMINGVVCAFINIALDIILIRIMGHNGAALATSLVAIFGDIVLIAVLSRKGVMKLRKQFITIIKTIVSAVLSVLCAYLAYKKLAISIDCVYQRIFMDGLIAGFTFILYWIFQFIVNRQLAVGLFGIVFNKGR